MPDLVNPYEAVTQRPQDFALDNWERQQVENLSTKDYKSQAAVAAGIAGAFLVYRHYMQRKVKDELKRAGNFDYDTLDYAMSIAYQGFIPSWIRMLVNQTTMNYAMSLADNLNNGTIPPEMLYDTAEQYASKVGKYMNDSTSEAVLKGYQAQVNRKIAKKTAVDNVVDAIGATNQGMNTLVSVWTQKTEKQNHNLRTPDVQKQKVQGLIQAEVNQRANVFGANEAEVQASQINQVVWMYSVDKGIIPVDTQRVWRTRKDERVCPVCGPLDGVSIPVMEKFPTPSGNLWSPPAHVGCRCKAELDYDYRSKLDRELSELMQSGAQEPVAKALGSDKYDRDKNGRFASHEGRNAKTFVRPKETSAWENLQERMNQASLNDFLGSAPEDEPKLDGPKLDGPKLDGPKLGGPKLNGPVLNGPKLDGTKLGGNKGEAKLSDAKLGEAKLAQAVLQEASLLSINNAALKSEEVFEDEPEGILDQDGYAWYKSKTSHMCLVPAHGSNTEGLSTSSFAARDDDSGGQYSSTVDTNWYVMDNEGARSHMSADLGDYWWNQIDDISSDIMGSSDSVNINYREKSYFISEDEMMYAVQGVVFGDHKKFKYTSVTLRPHGPDGDEIEVPLANIVDRYKIQDRVDRVIPTILSTAFVSDSHYGNDQWIANPGTWNTFGAGDQSDEVDMGHGVPFKIHYVKPV